MKFLQKSLKMSQKVLAKVIFLSMFAIVVFAPVLSYAEEMKIKNPISAESINGFIKDVLVGLIKIGIPLIAIAIIYAGFLFVTAQGNPGDIEKAKKALMYTIIGGAILLGAWAIAQLISNTVLTL